MKTLLIIAIVLIGIIFMIWLGLQIKPEPFPENRSEQPDPEMVPLPEGLPPIVERYYHEVYGESVPKIDTAIITGRGTMRVNGITLPVRFRFIHKTGQSYRHYIEATLFGVPLLTINETYIDGKSRLELPFGVSEGSKIDQGANLALWAEAVWMPSVWVTNPDAHWAAMDNNAATLTVPFGSDKETFIVSFDPKTGLLKRMESMRYKNEESEEKTLWINEVLEWDELDGRLIPVVTAITWKDEGSPWAILTVEEIAYNEVVESFLHTSEE
ncbi:hypothetical protein KQH62_02680 [bacterium]|nr:hypothetical protein [bacterium]